MRNFAKILGLLLVLSLLVSCGGGGGGGGGGGETTSAPATTSTASGGSTFTGTYSINGNNYTSLAMSGDANSGTATFTGASGNLSGSYQKQGASALAADVTFSGTYIITFDSIGTITVIFAGNAVTISAGTATANGSGQIVVVVVNNTPAVNYDLTGTWVANYPMNSTQTKNGERLTSVLTQRDEYVFRPNGTFTITYANEGDRRWTQSSPDHYKHAEIWSGTYVKRDDFYYITVTDWTEKVWVDYIETTNRNGNPNTEVPFYALINNNRLYYSTITVTDVYYRESGSPGSIVGKWKNVSPHFGWQITNGEFSMRPSVTTSIMEFCADGTLKGGDLSGTQSVGTYSFSGNSLTVNGTNASTGQSVSGTVSVILTDNWFVLGDETGGAVKQ